MVLAWHGSSELKNAAMQRLHAHRASSAAARSAAWELIAAESIKIFSAAPIGVAAAEHEDQAKASLLQLQQEGLVIG